MRGTNWTWAFLAAAIALSGAAEAPAGELQRRVVMKIELEEGRSPDGEIVALRVRMDGPGMALCGTSAGVEFTRVGEAMLSKTVQPFQFKTEGLDCGVSVSWEESGPRIQVRGGRMNGERPPAAPAETQEPLRKRSAPSARRR